MTIIARKNDEARLRPGFLFLWYYEKEEEKRVRLNYLIFGVVPEPTENKEEKENPSNISSKICFVCNRQTVEIDPRTGKAAKQSQK